MHLPPPTHLRKQKPAHTGILRRPFSPLGTGHRTAADSRTVSLVRLRVGLIRRKLPSLTFFFLRRQL